MQQFLGSIREAIRQENWFGALFMALAMPDICGNLDTGNKNVKERYIAWATKYLCPQYKHKLNADVFYELRCSCLHAGTHVETKLGARLFLVTPDESPLHDSDITLVPGQPHVHLRIDVFCEDVCKAVEAWIDDVEGQQSIQNNMQMLLHLTGDPSRAHKIIFGDASLTWGQYSAKGLFLDLPACKGFKPFWLHGGRIPEYVLEELGESAEVVLKQKLDWLITRRNLIAKNPSKYVRQRINEIDGSLSKLTPRTPNDSQNISMHEHLTNLKEEYKQEPTQDGQVDQDSKKIQEYIEQTRQQISELGNSK